MAPGYERDLFGQPLPDASAFRKDGAKRKIGYADRPGTGPKGQRCGTCLHLQRCVRQDNASHKCELMTTVWNYRPETDVHPQAPACSKWDRRPFKHRPI